ncbi:hypothetical protein PV08_01287 [Exophiala spinifera]|uniref:Zn(2)-C6 fungal-type domain-containing protein n=1 Tax=Exophiala spinifera TaxID=91928 RepID=A0A0D2BQE6_9EURO|nr:uncharacterized protein PV08_01287 [Exophiala spinifera]KIW20710.1 hypothetical protein PV08_01287 [Exophiala spinifera]
METGLHRGVDDLTNVFVLSSDSGSTQGLFQVPKSLNIDPARQRRAHRKSRAGCDNCKRRRIKCNEELPCGNCTRRKEPCHISRRAASAVLTSSSPTQPVNLETGPSPMGANVNLLHMELFHHFQTSTQHTLVGESEFWAYAIRLSFHFDYVMNAILCVAARHRASLQPGGTMYATAANNHLSRALVRFRHEMARPFPSMHLDAFILTSRLLHYEIWMGDDVKRPQEDVCIMHGRDALTDRLFSYCSSMKQVFLKCVPPAFAQPSVCISHMQHNSPIEFLTAMSEQKNSNLRNQYRNRLLHSPISPELLDLSSIVGTEPAKDTSNKFAEATSALSEHEDGEGEIAEYERPVSGLSLLLSFLPGGHSQSEGEPQNVNSSHVETILPKLASYILLFPVQCYGPFASKVQQSDLRALIVLYHFYRAVRILLPSRVYWWAHHRARASEQILHDWLTRQMSRSK